MREENHCEKGSKRKKEGGKGKGKRTPFLVWKRKDGAATATFVKGGVGWL